jgi:hypothetical protein
MSRAALALGILGPGLRSVDGRSAVHESPESLLGWLGTVVPERCRATYQSASRPVPRSAFWSGRDGRKRVPVVPKSG